MQMIKPQPMRTFLCHALLLSVPLASLGCSDDSEDEEEAFAPSCDKASNYDTTTEELAERWSEWVLEPEVPPFASEECVDGGQEDGIWFLAGTTGADPVTRECKIPANTALFIPPVNVLLIPCPEMEGCETPTSAKDMVSAVTSLLPDDPDQLEMRITVDGEELEDACAKRENTQRFTFAHSDPDAACLGEFPADVCPELELEGERTAAVDGWWSLIAPLPPGDHTIRMVSEVDFGDAPFNVDVTYEVEVEAESE